MRGLYDGDGAVLSAISNNSGLSFPHISKTSIRDLAERSGVVVVDARPPAAFNSGHLPEAINFPVDARLVSVGKSILYTMACSICCCNW
jgi:hypothetical protein